MENARLAAIVESSTDAIIGKTTEGVVTDWNRAAERMFGYTAAEAVGRTVLDLIVPADHREEEANILASVARGETVPHLYTQRLRRDRSRFDVAVTVSPIHAADGRIVGASKIVRDISAQKAAEAAFTEAQARVMVVTRDNGIGLWDRDLVSGHVNCDETLLALFDPVRPDFIQWHEDWRSCIHPDDLAGVDQALDAAINGRTPLATDFRIVTKCGDIKYIGTKATVYYDDAGVALRILGACFDITNDKLHERRIADLNATLQARTRDAEAATMAKSQFLANVSHEIRSPMNAILGMLQLLRDTDLSDIQRNYAANALAATRSLLGLLNDLLDFSKLEAEKMEVDSHPFSIESLIRDLASVLVGSKTNDAVELQLLVDPRLTVQLDGDGYRLRQVLLNLAGNAIKFTERGEVVISVQIAAQTAEQIMVDFAISDTGIGIAPDRLAHIFASFSQGESSTTRRYGGTGLGLTISQRLVGLMGGSLAVESRLGSGSRFYFTLPFANVIEGVDQREILPVQAATSDGLPRILIIDTPHGERRALLDMAQALGWQADSITGGIAALAALAKPRSARLYDIIFVDWSLSGPDAVEIIRQVRQFWHLRQIPVIAVISPSSRKSVGEALRTHPTLLNGFLVKPFTATMLFDAMVDVADGKVAPGAWIHKAPRAEVRPQTGPRLTGLRLLVVEDNLTNQMVARELLVKEGAVVDVAGGGVAGVQQATSKYLSYDAVLMDIQMPDLDGYGATRQIRRNKDRQSLPVIAMTANAMASDKAACLEAGMDDHIAKPIDLDVVVETLLRHCGPARLPPQNAANPPASRTPPVAISDSDVDLALQRIGDNRALFVRLAEQFINDSPAMSLAVQRDVHDGARPKAAATLHTLRGMAATVGASRLADLSRKLELELDLKSAGRPDDVASGLDELAALVAASCLTLKTIAAGFGGQQTNASKPADHGARAAMLNQLEDLLENSDMRATALYQDLRLEWDSDLDDQIVTLGSTINRLDFSAAAMECRAIRSIVQ
jgi:PAS domain S-box-containing protein